MRYWGAAYVAKLPADEDFGEFYRALEWVGTQRHLKVTDVLARLCYRDGKIGYAGDTPHLITHLCHMCSRYNALMSLTRLLDQLKDRTRQIGYMF